MGNPNDCTPETAAAAGFAIVTSALEYAKKHVPEFVPDLEKVQLAWARRLAEL